MNWVHFFRVSISGQGHSHAESAHHIGQLYLPGAGTCMYSTENKKQGQAIHSFQVVLPTSLAPWEFYKNETNERTCICMHEDLILSQHFLQFVFPAASSRLKFIPTASKSVSWSFRHSDARVSTRSERSLFPFYRSLGKGPHITHSTGMLGLTRRPHISTFDTENLGSFEKTVARHIMWLQSSTFMKIREEDIIINNSHLPLSTTFKENMYMHGIVLTAKRNVSQHPSGQRFDSPK